MPGSRTTDFSLPSVQVPLSPMERFADFLRLRGKRLTSQRRWIVEQVFSHHDHFDADELMGHLAEGDKVEFEVTKGPKGLQASNVRKV